MTKLLRFLSLPLLATMLLPAQQIPNPVHPSEKGISVDMLSDAAAPTTDPYMRSLMSELGKHWLVPAAEAHHTPAQAPQETVIRLTIAPDGKLQAMQIETATHNPALDKAAWDAAKNTTYSPPPTGMKDPRLTLRIHFVV